MGKVDNGQVAVFGALVNGQYAAPIDERLYLREEWTEDSKRCEKAGIPENEREFHTKPELGLEIVRHARKNNLRFGWVGADAGYGKGPKFCNGLDEMSETFVIDIHFSSRLLLGHMTLIDFFVQYMAYGIFLLPYVDINCGTSG